MPEPEHSSPVSSCSGNLSLGRSVCFFLGGTLLSNMLDKIKSMYPLLVEGVTQKTRGKDHIHHGLLLLCPFTRGHM